MAQEILDQLLQDGIDFRELSQRMMGNVHLAKKFLIKFLDDQTLTELKRSFEANDKEAMLLAVHTLKGVSGNLSFIKLYDVCSQMVKDLRENKDTDLEKEYQQICEIHQVLINAIQTYLLDDDFL